MYVRFMDSDHSIIIKWKLIATKKDVKGSQVIIA